MLSKYKIALVINADNNYINRYTITTLKSFLFHNKWFNGDIIFFDDNTFFTISEDNKKTLKSIYNNIIFKTINFNKYKNIIEKFNYINDYNKNLLKAYPKFEIFNLYEYDKILCIDGDILFVDNIKELFFKDISLGVTSAMRYYVLKNKLNDYIIDKYYKTDKYFNSGLIYIGNKFFLKQNITNLIISYTENLLNKYDSKTTLYDNKKMELFDQDILNYFLYEYYYNNFTYISPIYNVERNANNLYWLLDNWFINDEKDLHSKRDIEFIKYMKYVFYNAKIFHYILKPNCGYKDNNTYFDKLWNFYKNLPLDLIKC